MMREVFLTSHIKRKSNEIFDIHENRPIVETTYSPYLSHMILSSTERFLYKIYREEKYFTVEQLCQKPVPSIEYWPEKPGLEICDKKLARIFF